MFSFTPLQTTCHSYLYVSPLQFSDIPFFLLDFQPFLFVVMSSAEQVGVRPSKTAKLVIDENVVGNGHIACHRASNEVEIVRQALHGMA